MTIKNKKHGIVLSIMHNIYLTRDQRYGLASGKGVVVTGVSCPVWFYKGTTSEPAVEVFSKYLLTNSDKEHPISIESGDVSYRINIPQIPKDFLGPRRISDDEWRKLSYDQQQKWYDDNSLPKCGRNLLDAKDGGGAYLHFSQHNKIKREYGWLDVYHCVEIKTIESLEETLYFNKWHNPEETAPSEH